MNTGQIGDTIGGTTAPIVGIVSIVLLAYTLIEQLKFNAKQVDLQRQEQFKTTFFELLKEQGDIKNSLFTKYEGVDMKDPTRIQKIIVKGQDFFRMGSFVLKNLFESMEYGRYCHAYDPEEIGDQLTPIRDKIAISCMLRQIPEFSSHAIRHGLYIKNRKRFFCP